MPNFIVSRKQFLSSMSITAIGLISGCSNNMDTDSVKKNQSSHSPTENKETNTVQNSFIRESYVNGEHRVDSKYTFTKASLKISSSFTHKEATDINPDAGNLSYSIKNIDTYNHTIRYLTESENGTSLEKLGAGYFLFPKDILNPAESLQGECRIQRAIMHQDAKQVFLL